MYSRTHEHALADLRHAHALNPNDAFGLAMLGFGEAVSGHGPVGVELGERALRLSPRDPLRYMMLNALAGCHAMMADYARGARVAQEPIAAVPAYPAPLMCLLACSVGLVNIARARSVFATLKALNPAYVQARLAGGGAIIDNKLRISRSNALFRSAGAAIGWPGPSVEALSAVLVVGGGRPSADDPLANTHISGLGCGFTQTIRPLCLGPEKPGRSRSGGPGRQAA